MNLAKFLPLVLNKLGTFVWFGTFFNNQYFNPNVNSPCINGVLPLNCS